MLSMLSMLSLLLLSLQMATALTGITHGSYTLHARQRWGPSRSQSHCRLMAASDDEPGNSGVLAAAAGALVLAALAGSAYGVVGILGFDAGAGGDNGGYGAPLSTQELRRLQSDETLQRKTLLTVEGALDGVGRADVEDQKEDEALLRIIAGQGPRATPPR